MPPFQKFKEDANWFSDCCRMAWLAPWVHLEQDKVVELTELVRVSWIHKVVSVVNGHDANVGCCEDEQCLPTGRTRVSSLVCGATNVSCLLFANNVCFWSLSIDSESVNE